MSLHVLTSGVIFREVERKTSKAGNAFAIASIRIRDGQFV
jgi:hypothetical protein